MDGLIHGTVPSPRKVAFSGEGFVKRDLEDLGRRAGVEVFRQDDYVPEWKAG